MRHLKRFNEELDPETYKRTGDRLSNWHGQRERGARISQYGHDLAGDLIGFWIGDGKSTTAFQLPLEFHYKNAKINIPKNADDYESFYMGGAYYTEKISEAFGNLVEKYRDGIMPLYFDLELNFEISPRQQVLMKDLQNKIENNKSSGEETGMVNKHLIKVLSQNHGINLLTIRVDISENLYWENDDGDPYKPNDEQFYNAFENVFHPHASFSQPSPIKNFIRYGNGTTREEQHHLLAIPCSRYEANRLKKNAILKVAEDVKPLVHDLISEHVQGRPEDFEKIIKSITHMKINSMYRDKIDSRIEVKSFYNQFIKGRYY